MKLPVEWIKEHVPVKAGPDEIAERLTMAGLEVEERAESDLGAVLDIKVTPNRGDCLSVIGVSRELAAAYKMPLKQFEAQSSGGQAGEAAQLTSVSIEDPDLCPRYAARIVRNLKIGPSPEWMQKRLEAAGMRPISNIVDVTNYVMLEMGQPLHAFDFETLLGRRIVVRRARPGETITTLDGTERALTPEMLCICDADRPVAVAGVMGGAEAEVSAATTTLLLESAHFNWLSVRRTARALGMRTEASDRFSRGVDPELVAAAADRACALIAQIGAGEVVPGIVDAYPVPFVPRQLSVRPDRVTEMLGFRVSPADVSDTLTRLGFHEGGGKAEAGSLLFAVPTWRPDIVREIDLVEEVGRVLGYEHIPESLPTGVTTQGGDSQEARFAEQIRDILVGAGLQEIVSHSLLAPTNWENPSTVERRVGIRSALSAELSGLRRSLLPGLVEAVERNARRGNGPLAFFEVGHVFTQTDGGYAERPVVGGVLAGNIAPSTWLKSARQPAADFYTARGIVEQVAQALHVEGLRLERGEDPRLHPGRSANVYIGDEHIGYVGELHPRLTEDLTVRDRVVAFSLQVDTLQAAAAGRSRFTPLSPFPSVSRDLAPRVAAEVPYGRVELAVTKAGVEYLERFDLTDVYTGPPIPEGQKSLTLSFTFRSPEATLTDEQVNEALGRIRTSLAEGCGASFPT
jgi:phenylalanyl-tRNA synthetase beta chain